MKVTLEDHTQNPVETIGRLAAICYDSSTTTEACIRRAKSCVTKGHLATLRFAHATFRIEGISRTCSHQLVRHKHLDFLQKSQRYVKEEDPTFVWPGTSGEADDLITRLYFEAEKTYKDLLELGVRKEDARYVLPGGITTDIIVVGNFQAWLDFIRLRTDKSAQWEIRDVALEIKKQLAEIAPEIFNDCTS